MREIARRVFVALLVGGLLMAGIWADTFGWYTREQLRRFYTDTQRNLADNDSIGDVGAFGPDGAPGFRHSGNFTDTCRKLNLTTVQSPTGILQVRFRMSANPPQRNIILAFYDGTSIQCGLRITPTRRLELVRGLSTALADPSSYAIPLNTFVVLAFEATIDNASGAARVLVWEDVDGDPTVALSLQNVDTQATSNARWNGFEIGAACNGTTDYAHLIVMDGSGSRWNSLIGARARVSQYLPEADGALVGWTPSSGDHHAAVDDETADDDTSYVAASTAATDTYDFEDVSDDEGIAFVLLALVAKVESLSGTDHLAHVARENGSNTVSDGETLTEEYLAYPRVYQETPAGERFTPTRINAMEWGQQLAGSADTARVTQAVLLAVLVDPDEETTIGTCVTPDEGEDLCHIVDVPELFGSWDPGDGKRWFAETDLDHPSDYYDGYKRGTLVAVSAISRKATSSTWDYQIGHFSVMLAEDEALRYRGLFDDDPGRAFTGREVELFMATPSGMAAAVTAKPIALGIVDADPVFDELDEGLTVTLACRDRLGAAFSWTVDGQAKIPRRILTPTTLPGLVPAAVGLGAPYPYGRLGIQVQASGVLTTPVPSGLVAYCASAAIEDKVFWNGGFAPGPSSPQPPSNLTLTVSPGGDLSTAVPASTYYVQVFARKADGTIGDPTPFCNRGKSAVVSTGNQTITATWTASPDAHDYLVYLGTFFFGVTWHQYIVASGTSAVFTKNPPFGTGATSSNITPGANVLSGSAKFYYYRVRGKSANQRSGWSSPDIFLKSGTSFPPDGRLRTGRIWWASETDYPEFEVERRGAFGGWTKRWTVSGSQQQNGLYYFNEQFDTPGAMDLTSIPEQPEGAYAPVYTGTVELAGRERHRWLIAGCAIKSIQSFYYQEPDKEVEVNQLTNWLVPGLGDWTSVIGSGTYQDIEGTDGLTRRYTFMYGHGEKANLAASGTATISLDLEGIERVGDGSGEVLTSLYEQFEHCVNYLMIGSGTEAYYSGPWGPRPTMGRQGICVVEDTAIQSLKTMREAAFGGTIEGAGVVGAFGERVSVTEELGRWGISGDFRLGPNRHWQARAFALDEAKDASAVTAIDADLEVHARTFRPQPRLTELFNRFTYRYGRNYVRNGEWEADGLERINTTSRDKWRVTQELDLSFHYLRDPDAVDYVLGCIERRMGDAPVYVTFEGSLCFQSQDYDLGQYVRFTHWRGPAPSGYVNRPLWVLESTLLPDRRRVRIVAQDVRRLIPPLPGDSYDEDVMPRQWPLDLGGGIIQASGYTPVPNARPYQLQASDFAGFTVDLVLNRYTIAASGTIRAALKDEDGTILGEMATASTDMTATREIVDVTLPSTQKWCWLEAKGDLGYCVGYLRVRRTT